jgi:hypothetical protein
MFDMKKILIAVIMVMLSNSLYSQSNEWRQIGLVFTGDCMEASHLNVDEMISRSSETNMAEGVSKYVIEIEGDKIKEYTIMSNGEKKDGTISVLQKDSTYTVGSIVNKMSYKDEKFLCWSVGDSNLYIYAPGSSDVLPNNEEMMRFAKAHYQANKKKFVFCN